MSKKNKGKMEGKDVAIISLLSIITVLLLINTLVPTINIHTIDVDAQVPEVIQVNANNQQYKDDTNYYKHCQDRPFDGPDPDEIMTLCG